MLFTGSYVGMINENVGHGYWIHNNTYRQNDVNERCLDVDSILFVRSNEISETITCTHNRKDSPL